MMFAIKRDNPNYYYRKNGNSWGRALDIETVFTGEEVAHRLRMMYQGEEVGLRVVAVRLVNTPQYEEVDV